MQCSNYIWVINNVIAYSSAAYISDQTVNQYTLFVLLGAKVVLLY